MALNCQIDIDLREVTALSRYMVLGWVFCTNMGTRYELCIGGDGVFYYGICTR